MPGRYWWALEWTGTWFCLETMPRNMSYSGNTAPRPADAELCEVSCCEGKLLTSFLLAVNLPLCLFVSLRGPQE